MVSATDPLICDICNEGFCEIIDKASGISSEFADQQDQNEVDEEKRRVNEQYRIVFGESNPLHNRLDITNRSTSNIYGEPT